jgi:hypothetical protein
VPWLCRDEAVLASLEVAHTRAARRRGLLGRDAIHGGLLITPCRSVHTVGMRFTLDVAYLDADLAVLEVARMVPNRIGLPRWAARSVLEAAAGAFERWGLAPGDVLEVR